MYQSNRITEGALLIAVYIVLLLIVIFVPFIFIVGLLVLPIPFIIFATRYGYRPALLMFLAAISLSLLFATIISLPVTLLAGIGGIVIGNSIHNGKKPYETWAQGTIGYIIGMIAIIVMMQVVLNINIYSETELIIEDSISMMRTMMEQFGGEQLEQFTVIEEQMRSFPDLLPASIAIISIFLALGSIWFSFKVMNRLENKQLAFPPFRQFSLPRIIIWIYFFTIVAFLFIQEDDTFYTAILNIIMLLIVLITIHGFSFVFFFTHYKKLHRSIPFIVIVLSLLIPSLFMLMTQFLGIIDLALNLKSRLMKANEK